MGLEDRRDEQGIFLSINGEGLFARRVDSTEPNAVARKITKGDNEGNEIHELFYDRLNNVRITGIKIERPSFGVQQRITLEDAEDGSIFKLSLGISDRFGSNFLKKVESIDLDKPMNLAPHSFEKDRKKIVVITIEQDGKRIPQNYTKDVPKGPSGVMPQPTMKKQKGKEVWDWEAPEEFLYNIAEKMEKVFQGAEAPKPKPKPAPAVAEDSSGGEYTEVEGDPDDLPF